MKILIIDDSPEALAIAKSRLKSECPDIICANSGKEGLKMAEKERPDLVLLDIDMPEMTGFDVCRALKADPELCMIPVLFLSGSVGAEDKIRGLDLGAVDYVTKPFDVFELQARVRAALRTKRLQDMLIEHAHIDPLTGLANRRSLMDRLLLEWTRMERYGQSFSFIMADIDHFKKVNDTYGHIVGDKVLQEVAKTITSQCRSIDLSARYGGEEFAIIVPDENEEKTLVLAERCRMEIEKVRLPVKRMCVHTTVSFGIAEALGLSSLESLIEHADEALYEAKQGGRNRVVRYSSIHQASHC